MEIEVFTLCDAAGSQAGKLSLLGLFDSIRAAQCPVVLASCAVVARLRFVGSEEDEVSVGVQIIDADSRLVAASSTSRVVVSIPPALTSTTHDVINLFSPLVLARYGDYQIDLLVDGEVARSLPLQVLPVSALAWSF